MASTLKSRNILPEKFQDASKSNLGSRKSKYSRVQQYHQHSPPSPLKPECSKFNITIEDPDRCSKTGSKVFYATDPRTKSLLVSTKNIKNAKGHTLAMHSIRIRNERPT